MEAVTFAEVLDLRGCIFQDNVSFVKSRFLGDAKFSGARFQKQADFADTYFWDAGLLHQHAFSER